MGENNAKKRRNTNKKRGFSQKNFLAFGGKIMYTHLTWWGIVGVVPLFVGDHPTIPAVFAR